jgi:putative redox protein
MISRQLQFDNGRGQLLTGRMDHPEEGETGAVALFAHCFTCNKNYKAVTNISKALTEQGISVFRFDFTGLGESEGDFADTNFTSNARDLIAGATFLEKSYRAPTILIGHSLGGAAVLQAAPLIESSRAVATIAAPCEPKHLQKLLNLDPDTVEQRGAVEIVIGGRPFKITGQFLDDLESTRMRDTIHGLGRALLIFHSPFDKIVGIDNAALIFQAAQHPKSFISLDRADHLLSNESDSHYVGAVIGAWSRRYL